LFFLNDAGCCPDSRCQTLQLIQAVAATVTLNTNRTGRRHEQTFQIPWAILKKH
jgi:hypothetical protein